MAVALVRTFHLDVRFDLFGLVALLALVHVLARPLARHLHTAHGQYPGHKHQRQQFFHYFFHINELVSI